MSKKRKAFTLTELLVVVVIIGVLSAVVLPKFIKVIENRKTTEAEEMMAAVRTEQEARCSISKNYTKDKNSLRSYKDGKNFDYTLDKVGMTASAKSGKYTLKMPSYVDGRICCSEGCESLNKDYPKCGEIPNFIPGNESCGANWETAAAARKTTDCTDGATMEADCTNNCGDSGVKTNKCVSGHWSGWSACSAADKDSCGSGGQICTPGVKKADSCACGVEKGKVCNAQGMGWDSYNDGTCELTQTEVDTCACKTKPNNQTRSCEEGTGTQTMEYVCQNGDWAEGEWKGECASECDRNTSYAKNCEDSGGTLDDQCKCQCPEHLAPSSDGECCKPLGLATFAQVWYDKGWKEGSSGSISHMGHYDDSSSPNVAPDSASWKSLPECPGSGAIHSGASSEEWALNNSMESDEWCADTFPQATLGSSQACTYIYRTKTGGYSGVPVHYFNSYFKITCKFGNDTLCD